MVLSLEILHTTQNKIKNCELKDKINTFWQSQHTVWLPAVSLVQISAKVNYTLFLEKRRLPHKIYISWLKRETFALDFRKMSADWRLEIKTLTFDHWLELIWRRKIDEFSDRLLIPISDESQGFPNVKAWQNCCLLNAIGLGLCFEQLIDPGGVGQIIGNYGFVMTLSQQIIELSTPLPLPFTAGRTTKVPLFI